MMRRHDAPTRGRRTRGTTLCDGAAAALAIATWSGWVWSKAEWEMQTEP